MVRIQCLFTITFHYINMWVVDSHLSVASKCNNLPPSKIKRKTTKHWEIEHDNLNNKAEKTTSNGVTSLTFQG